jgi:hypothetical protein
MCEPEKDSTHIWGYQEYHGTLVFIEFSPETRDYPQFYTGYPQLVLVVNTFTTSTCGGWPWSRL